MDPEVTEGVLTSEISQNRYQLIERGFLAEDHLKGSLSLRIESGYLSNYGEYELEYFDLSCGPSTIFRPYVLPLTYFFLFLYLFSYLAPHIIPFNSLLHLILLRATENHSHDSECAQV